MRKLEPKHGEHLKSCIKTVK